MDGEGLKAATDGLELLARSARLSQEVGQEIVRVATLSMTRKLDLYNRCGEDVTRLAKEILGRDSEGSSTELIDFGELGPYRFTFDDHSYKRVGLERHVPDELHENVRQQHQEVLGVTQEGSSTKVSYGWKPNDKQSHSTVSLDELVDILDARETLQALLTALRPAPEAPEEGMPTQ